MESGSGMATTDDKAKNPSKGSVSAGSIDAGASARVGAYLGAGDVFDHSIAEFAEAYADQNDRDYLALKDAVAIGRIEAKTGI